MHDKKDASPVESVEEKYAIAVYPDPVLKQRALPVTDENLELAKGLVGAMRTLAEQHEGNGLAAPQIGHSLRLVIVRHENDWIELVNPVIVESSGTASMPEGCLSLPNPQIRGFVDRPAKVTVQCKDFDGKQKTLKADGWEARIILHEMDHLDGILFVDRFKPLKARLVAKHLNALRKAYQG